MKLQKNWWLTLIRCCHTILLQVILRLSFLMHETLAVQDLDNVTFPYFEVMCEELGCPKDEKFFSFMMFPKHKQQTSIASTLTITILRM